LNLHAEFKLQEDHEFEKEASSLCRHSEMFAQELRVFLIRVDEISKYVSNLVVQLNPDLI
jgi:hypothetical protein